MACILTIRECQGSIDSRHFPMTVFATIHTGTLRVGSTIMAGTQTIGKVSGIVLRGRLLWAITPGYETLISLDTPYTLESFCTKHLTA